MTKIKKMLCMGVIPVLLTAYACGFGNRNCDLPRPPPPPTFEEAAEWWEAYLMSALYPTLEALADGATDIVRARIVGGWLVISEDTDRPAATIFDADPSENNILTLEITGVYRTGWNPMESEYTEDWEALVIGRQIDLSRNFSIDFTMNDREYVLFLYYFRDVGGWIDASVTRIIFPVYQSVYIFNPNDPHAVMESPTPRPELALEITYNDILGIKR